MSHFKAKML